MERVAFTMKLLPGAEAEYRRRHAAVWPEMLDALRAAGCGNYSIYQRDDDLFGVFDVLDFDRFRAMMDARPSTPAGRRTWRPSSIRAPTLRRASIDASRRCSALTDSPLRLVAIDLGTWGVDFGLLDARGRLLGNPVHYRDARTAGVPELAFGVVPREEIYRATGIQFMPINTLFQLYSMARAGDPQLRARIGC